MLRNYYMCCYVLLTFFCSTYIPFNNEDSNCVCFFFYIPTHSMLLIFFLFAVGQIDDNQEKVDKQRKKSIFIQLLHHLWPVFYLCIYITVIVCFKMYTYRIFVVILPILTYNVNNGTFLISCRLKEQI